MPYTTTTDRATGYVPTAADWNIIEDNLTYLYGDVAWTNVSVFTNSWVAFGAPEFAPGFRLVGNRVYLRGCLKTGTPGNAAFTLPAGYRPTATCQFAVASNAALGIVQIGSSGVVTPTAVGSTVSFFLDGISFDTLA
jgi:hypothetical protein